ncbi:dynein regulatory complex subunit 6-like [Agrilus planipennis]|uniref:Dynein regulatory complex subunit 6-like n=1 Tax=Agrilus planipennis TaxID=224129 RepID=A0A1W4X3W5_AGRPL|nr:dynein regulatory complex subunit 6-like [Agrilus planipennis]
MVNFLDLPNEVLSQIVACLSYSDRAVLKTTCKRLYKICSENDFIRRERIVIENQTVSQDKDCLLLLYRCTHPFFSVVLKNVQILYDSLFWIDFGIHIEKLSFINCQIKCENLYYILASCQNLQYLTLNNIKELYTSFSAQTLTMDSLISLELCSPIDITDYIYHTLINSAPNLTHLSVKNCKNFCNQQISNQFYHRGGEPSLSPSKTIFSFTFVTYTIRLRKKKLTSLDFSNSSITREGLFLLLPLNGFKLVSLNVSGCDQLVIPNWAVVSRLQPYIEKLYLNYIPGCPLDVLFSPLPNLTILELDGMHNCAEPPHRIECPYDNLKELSLKNSCCEAAQIVFKLVLPSGTARLEKFSLGGCMGLPWNELYNNVEKYSATLIHINFSGSVCVDYKILEIIFNRCKRLKELCLSNCQGVTDGGLISIETVDFEVGDLEDKMEIISGAARSGYFRNNSIMNLTNLQALSLKNCICVTDFSLKAVFKFKELISLNLSGCQNITMEGIRSLIASVPSLEILNLSTCYNIDDDGINVICNGFKRLKKLILEGCIQLTDETLEAILSTPTIQQMNVKGCTNLSEDFLQNIELVLENRRSLY